METTVADNSVRIELKDFITLTADQIARQVSENLRREHIDPLAAEVALIKLKLSRPSHELKTITKWEGALEASWKLGVVLWVLFQAYHQIH